MRYLINRLNQLLTWLYNPILYSRISRKNPSINTPWHKHLQTLENRLQGAIHFLKTSSVHRNGKKIKLHTLPWYLLIGSSGSGKSTLLTNSNVNFILEKQLDETHMKPVITSGSCDWWVTPDAVLVDVPGSYVSGKEKKNTLTKQQIGRAHV